MERWKTINKINLLLYRLLNFLIGFIYLIKKVKCNKTLKRNLDLKNKFKNERCFILGNGPSLKSEKLDLIKNEKIFVVNFFFKNTFAKMLMPTFYCACDPVFYRDKDKSNYLMNLIQTKKDLTFFLPLELEKRIKQYDKVYYFLLKKFFTQRKSVKNIDYLLQLAPQNVVVYCLLIAIYMGFKEIFILGQDFNSFSTQYDEHSYGKGVMKLSSLENELFSYQEICRQHRLISNISMKMGIKITNLTKNSLLDVYVKNNLESICKSKKKD